MSIINIGVTQEYTQINVQSPTEIVIPETTGSPTNSLSRKMILLVVNGTATPNYPITWSMVTGVDTLGSSSSSAEIPAGSASSGLIVWENNDIPSAIGQVSGEQPEALMVELWEDELAPGVWVWYGKYTRYGDAIAPVTTEMVDIFLEAAGPAASYTLNEVYGTKSSSGDPITVDDAYPGYASAEISPTGQFSASLHRREPSGSISSFGHIIIAAGQYTGAVVIYAPTVLNPGDIVYMYGPSALDASLIGVTVLLRGCKTNTAC